MKRTLQVVVLLTAAFLVAFLYHPYSAGAQAPAPEGHQHTHTHERSEKLGRVNFTLSCTPEARKQFNRAVAWLHSFEYEGAEKAFTKVIVTDLHV